MTAQDTLRNADLFYRLRGLAMGGAVLHLGSHPDDEETGLIAYLSRGLGVRTVYWSATRGEGGQNRSGPERAEALGILRTWESLDAREVDGGEVLYGPFYDFGFSRSGEDALSRWQRPEVIREIVRAIRLVQPQVLISRWKGGPEDGHGHHQAVGMVVAEAFDAAGDPTCFPDLVDHGLPAWQPQKLYRSALGDWQPGEDISLGQPVPELDREGALRVNLGAFDPVSGRSYQEIASIGTNRHRSQAMAILPARGDYFSYYHLDRSLVPASGADRSFFAGLDPTLTGLADQAGNEDTSLRPLLEDVKARAREAIEVFRPDRPEDSGMVVLEGLATLRRAADGFPRHRSRDGAPRSLDRYLARKIRDFEEVAARCLAIDVDCLIDDARLTPGRSTHVRTRVWNAGGQRLDGVNVRLNVPSGWLALRLDPSPGRDEASTTVPMLTAFEVTAPETVALASPYWLRDPRTPYRYAWPEGASGLPLDEPPITATCDLRVGDHLLSVVRPAVRRDTFVGGSRELPPEVLPPVALRPRERRQLLPASHREEHLELQLAVQATRGDVSGTLQVDAPDGWIADPAEVDVTLARSGEVRTIRIDLAIPGDAKPGVYEVRYRVASGGRDYGVVLTPVRQRAPGLSGPVDETNCIAETWVTAPATVSVHLIEAEFVGKLKHAYIPGVDEEIVSSLRHFGFDPTVLTSEELYHADLGLYDAIVVGPNAYLVSDDLRRNAARLLEYVEAGGTLIVQYQAYGYQAEGLAPFPFRYRQPHDRITAPDAPVTILDPDHAIVTVPNPITAEDFEGWVHDRGLYLFGEWDKRYQPLLESGDPGQDPSAGGLLVGSYGRGTYVYAGYSFFRQIPAGVPGAVRLFANIVGLPRARILDRMELAQRVPLLSFLDEGQLYDVVQLMAERWLDPGTILTREGDRGSELYMVLEGEVEVVKGDQGGRVVHVAGQGAVVGELAVLTDLPRSATLRARTDVKVLVMRGSHFRGFLRQHTDLSERMISILAERLASSEITF